MWSATAEVFPLLNSVPDLTSPLQTPAKMARAKTSQKGKAVSRSTKAGLQFPVGRIAR